MAELRFRCKINFNGTWEFDWASTKYGIDHELYVDVERWRFLLMMINSAVYENSKKNKKK
jgi:hypothetical protein